MAETQIAAPITGANGVGGTDGIAGENITANRQADTGTSGGQGTDGGSAISSGNDFTNTAALSGGKGGQGGRGGKGGDNLPPTDFSYGGAGGLGGVGGAGGDAVTVNAVQITNRSTISGGEGGAGGAGGVGGNGGSQYTGKDPVGHPGGSAGGAAGAGGKGGTAIQGDALTIVNNGRIQGGTGGVGGPGGVGGDATTYMYYSGEGGRGGRGGEGGKAISGSNLTIENHGVIAAGAGGQGGKGSKGGKNDEARHGENGAVGPAGVAIHLTGGTNVLELHAGSSITGDIIEVDDPGTVAATTLSIVGKAETTVTGNLKAGSKTEVTFSGDSLTLTGNADFDQGAKLSLAQDSRLIVDRNVNLARDATLAIAGVRADGTGNLDTGGTLTLGDNVTFEVSGIPDSTALAGGDKILFRSKNAIVGGFSTLQVNGYHSDVDYMTLNTLRSEDGLSFLARHDLAWYANNNLATGNFTVPDAESFTVDRALDNVAANLNSDTHWNGKSLTKKGQGTLILAAKNSYSGDTLISAGTLKTGVVDAITGTARVRVAQDATLNLGGNNQTLTALDNRGVLLINDLGAPPLSDAVTVNGNMTNSGTLVLDTCSGCASQTYVQQGDWMGENGTVSFGTVLGGDDSSTDKLKITGAATGTTYVEVRNAGGAGAQTLEGIELIQTASSTDDAFVQKGRIAAGAYDYHLQKGSASGKNENRWYLTSAGNSGGVRLFRPELGSYAGNLAAAATLFDTRLDDRQRREDLNPMTGEPYRHGLWVRAVGGRGHARMSDGQSRSEADRMVFQVGADVLDGSFNGRDGWRLGAMAGHGKQRSKTRNDLSGHQSRGDVEGYGVGLYGTWYRNAQTHDGLYVDGWALYNQFDNSVQGDALAREKYKSRGVTASLESGYVVHAGSRMTDGGERRFYLRPQAQLLWSGVKASDHVEQTGTKVSSQGSDNLKTRVGMRFWMANYALSADGKRSKTQGLKPFMEVNWLHRSKRYGARMDETRAWIQGARNVAELNLGVEGRLNDRLRVSANLTQQMGTRGYRDTQGGLDVKYRF